MDAPRDIDATILGRRPNHGRRPWRCAQVGGASRRPILSLLTCWATLAGCNDPVAPLYHITADGYAERGGTLALSLYNRGTLVPSGTITWTASPGAAVTIVRSGAVLIDTGAVTISAQIGGITKATLRLTVTTPPTVVFDLQDSGGTGNRDIYRVALDGQGLTRLSSGTGDNEQPTTAGTTVIFTSFRDGHAVLYDVATSGGAETKLSAAPAPASQPALSPDGTRLAFISASNGIDHLWTAAADGSSAIVASGDAGFGNALQASPAWAPAGDTVAVVTTEYGNAALARLAVASGDETALTTGTTTDLSPSWSPDGTTIAFASTRDGDLGVFLLTIATGGVRRVTASPGTDGEPTWLSDGRVAYTSGIGGATQLRWVDPAHADTSYVIPTPSGGNPHHPGTVKTGR